MADRYGRDPRAAGERRSALDAVARHHNLPDNERYALRAVDMVEANQKTGLTYARLANHPQVVEYGLKNLAAEARRLAMDPAYRTRMEGEYQKLKPEIAAQEELAKKSPAK